jgi:hypothetical protein
MHSRFNCRDIGALWKRALTLHSVSQLLRQERPVNLPRELTDADWFASFFRGAMLFMAGRALVPTTLGSLGPEACPRSVRLDCGPAYRIAMRCNTIIRVHPALLVGLPHANIY